jgi:hypothetical protein
MARTDGELLEYRRRLGMAPHQLTRTRSVAQGGCPECGHIMYQYPTADFCPCEGICHVGGLRVPHQVLARTG